MKRGQKQGLPKIVRARHVTVYEVDFADYRPVGRESDTSFLLAQRLALNLGLELREMAKRRGDTTARSECVSILADVPAAFQSTQTRFRGFSVGSDYLCARSSSSNEDLSVRNSGPRGHKEKVGKRRAPA